MRDSNIEYQINNTTVRVTYGDITLYPREWMEPERLNKLFEAAVSLLACKSQQ